MKSIKTVEGGAFGAQGLLLRGLVFFFPLFFLPVTSDFFGLNKLVLLSIVSSFAVLLWGICAIYERHFSYRVSQVDLGVLLFAGATLLSAFFATQNKLDAFVFPGMATAVLASAVLYFVIIQYLGPADATGSGEAREKVSGFVTAWVWGVMAAALISLLSGVGLFTLVGKVVSLPVWLKGTYFSTVGGVVPSVLLFIVSAPLVFGRVMRAVLRFERAGGLTASTAIYFGGFVIFVASLAFGIYQALPGKPSQFQTLPFQTGWSIALETLKRQPLFGVGVGDFSEAFNRFRPVEYNLTSFWNVSFGASTNWFLDVFTVSGLLGFLALLFLIFRGIRVIREIGGRGGDIPYLKASFFAFLLVFLFAPANLTLIFAFFVLLSLMASQVSRNVTLHFSVLGESASDSLQRGVNLAALVVSGVGVLVFGALVIFGGRLYLADVSYRKALNAVSTGGKYKEVMDNLGRAINLNKKVDFYRIDYAQVSLSLIQEIARKGELSDADRNDISQLIQAAIEQGKTAVSINSVKAANWASLAQIYRALIPVVQGADQFAIQVYQQAIALEPTNPNLRIALGGIFYSLKNYDEAIKAFELGVAAKPDLANAHYNLAVALRDAGKIERAALEFQQTLGLVEQNGRDWEVVKKELDALSPQLEARAREATASAQVSPGAGEQAPLEAPQPAPSPVVEPKLTLPQDSAPPSAGSGQGPASSSAEPN